MPIHFADLIQDFADALVDVDASRKAHKNFQSGIGPFGESDAVRAALFKMKELNPFRYTQARTRRFPDLFIPQGNRV
jgi:hypothetical protein